MAVKKKRFMLTVPEDVEADAAMVKRELFYDRPYSEMYRQLIRMGLDVFHTVLRCKRRRFSRLCMGRIYCANDEMGKKFRR